MGDKSPKKPPTKKSGATLKEKRAVKKAKRDEASSPSIVTRPSRG